LRVLANMVSVERAAAKIATAALTFAVSCNEKLSDLARREDTASVAADFHDRWLRVRTESARS
jgi:hypothetical protein